MVLNWYGCKGINQFVNWNKMQNLYRNSLNYRFFQGFHLF